MLCACKLQWVKCIGTHLTTSNTQLGCNRLETLVIEKIFASNCRDLRGERTQFHMSEIAKIPFRTYVGCEEGKSIPKKETRLALAKAFKVSESVLFQDRKSAPDPSLDRSIHVLRDALNDESTFEAICAVLRGREKFLKRTQ
jgi:transcriptional regulator with XRE-family HTH domain